MTNNYFENMIENLYDMTNTERAAEIETEIAAQIESYDIIVNDIRVYTDTENHENRWVYVLTENPIEHEVLVRLNICRALELDDIDFFVD